MKFFEPRILTHQVIVNNCPWFGWSWETGGLIQDGTVGDTLLGGNYFWHFTIFTFGGFTSLCLVQWELFLTFSNFSLLRPFFFMCCSVGTIFNIFYFFTFGVLFLLYNLQLWSDSETVKWHQTDIFIHFSFLQIVSIWFSWLTDSVRLVSNANSLFFLCWKRTSS